MHNRILHKRCLAIFLFFALFLCACSKPENLLEPVTPPENTIIDAPLFTINHPIETAFLEEEATLTGTTAEMVDFYAKYALLWEAEMLQCVALISELLLDDPSLQELHSIFIQYQEAWVNWNIENEAFKQTFENHLHKGGTIVHSNIERYYMGLYRARTIELIELYEALTEGRVA